MYNPFKENARDNQNNLELISLALNGNQKSLEDLVLNHQAWIFNIAFRMVADINAAEDITQEILIKMVTHLSTYDSEKGAFRTWLYRITANHVLNMKRSKHEAETFDLGNDAEYAKILEDYPEPHLESVPDYQLQLEEIKQDCINGLLICLDRKQRLVFILGVMFDVSSKLGSEILEISEANFRQILSRSRKKVFNFLTRNCGLIDEKSPCKCSLFVEKTKQVDDALQRKRLLVKAGKGRINQVTGDKMDKFNKNFYDDYTEIYRDQPLLGPPDLVDWFRKSLNSNKFKDIFYLQ